MIRRLKGLGTITIDPRTDGGRDDATLEVTGAFAKEWDHDLLNRAPMLRDIWNAYRAKRLKTSAYSIVMTYRGREFFTTYPKGDDL